MGIELELSVLLALSIVGQSAFARFEIETPVWRKILKWSILSGLTLTIYSIAGHWALLLPLFITIAGAAFHFAWCRRHGIDPVRATPVRTYYELRHWRWPQE